MSEVVTGALKLAFSFFRSFTAEKLQDGGLTDQKFRGLIVRELDDIKFKLDGLSRKDLATSLSYLRQGIERFHLSVGKSTESEDPFISKLPKLAEQSQDKTNTKTSVSTPTKPAQLPVDVDDALALGLANATGKMKIESKEILELAEKKFEKAAEKATEAFHNAALSTGERVLACKVRIASGILEHLERPEVAVSDCLQYLQELHDLPAIQDIFSVHIKAGIKSWMKSGFTKDSRIQIVETVTMINLTLADFILKFTKRRMGVLDWPMIKCGRRVVHPIHYKKDSLPNLKEMETTPPSWEMVKSAECCVKTGKCALNKKGDLVCADFDSRGLQKLDKTTGELQPYCVSPSQVKHTKNVHSLAVDDEDTVYVLSSDDGRKYTLSVYSENGVNTHHCTLEFFKVKFYLDIRMCVTEDKNIVICRENGFGHAIEVWICDSNGELRNSFIDQNKIDISWVMCVFATCNEIRVVTKKVRLFMDDDFVLRVYTEDGHLQRTIRYRPNGSFTYYSICYSKATTNIIGCIDLVDRILVEVWSDQTAELLRSYLLHKTNLPLDLYCPYDVRNWRANKDVVMVCHENGTLALVDTNLNVLFLAIKSCT